MNWAKAAVAKPQPHLIVLGAIREGDDRRAVRMISWDGVAWMYAPRYTPVQRHGRQVTHWMLLPEPPAADEQRKQAKAHQARGSAFLRTSGAASGGGA